MILSTGQGQDDRSPLVSVAMTAYNSAAWLSRSIESVFQQQTSFGFELVIGDDLSTDGTAAVLDRYKHEYASRIRVLPRSEKVGMQRNYYETFEQCRGKYIAWLDADDYWTDPQKLEVQVAVLEMDDSVGVCGHFVQQVKPTGEIVTGRCPSQPPGRYGLAEILAQNFIPSPSIVFRNEVQRGLPESFFGLSGMVDWPILLQAARTGDIVLLDRIMANYVLHSGSAYQGKGKLYQDTLDVEFYEWVTPTLAPQWKRAIQAAQGIRHDAISYHLVKGGKLPEARRAAYKALRVPHVLDNLSTKFKPIALVEATATVGKIRQILKRRNP